MFVQAIVTKYLGPTNHREGRIKATASAGSVVIPWDHGKGINENHTEAAHTLARKFGWTGTYQGGGMPNGTGNVYVRSQIFVGNGNNFVEEDSFHIAVDPETGEAVPEGH